MREIKQTTQGIYLRILRIALILASVVVMVFIFSNSLKTAEESTQQSSNVVDLVQKVAAVIAPDSQIANATGDAYDVLQGVIRSMAHFLEFCLLGALFSWTCFSYTFDKIWQICPALGVAAVAITDESLQLIPASRAFQFTDILVDVGGGVCGIAFAILCVWIGFCIYRNHKNKKEKARLLAELAAEEQPKEK